MKEIEVPCGNKVERCYNYKVLSAYKSKLNGLNSFCRLVMYEIFNYCNYETGVILLPSLEVLAENDFRVDPSPGRKRESINGDKLRNAFRTIKKAKPEHFKFSTQNQRIIIDMPFLRELFQQHLGEVQQVTAVDAEESVTQEIYASTDVEVDLESQPSIEDVTEDAAASYNSSRAECINNKNNIKNKQTTTHEEFPRKKLISKDFYPAQETIEKALALGYVNPTDPAIIQSFIEKNTAWGSVYYDFNPIYLLFLAKEPEFKQQKQLAQESLSRNKDHERTQPKNNTFEAAMEQVLRANPDPLAPSDELPGSAKIYCFDVLDHAEHPMVMERAIQTVRPTIHQQTWQQR
jgi:hypothetical protein